MRCPRPSPRCSRRWRRKRAWKADCPPRWAACPAPATCGSCATASCASSSWATCPRPEAGAPRFEAEDLATNLHQLEAFLLHRALPQLRQPRRSRAAPGREPPPALHPHQTPRRSRERRSPQRRTAEAVGEAEALKKHSRSSSETETSVALHTESPSGKSEECDCHHLPISILVHKQPRPDLASSSAAVTEILCAIARRLLEIH